MLLDNMIIQHDKHIISNRTDLQLMIQNVPPMFKVVVQRNYCCEMLLSYLEFDNISY